MEKRRFSLFWPILFIAVGIFLFLNNIGAIGGSTWEVLFKLWPLILIVAGLDGIWRREGFVGSTVVIGLGVVFLMGNLGYLQFGVWELLLRLWPLFIVALGLDLIIGRQKPWAALAGIGVGVLATAGILWLVLSSPLAVTLNREAVTMPLGEAQAARGTLSQPVGKLVVSGGASPANLLEGDTAVVSTQTLRKDLTASGTKATFDLSASGFSSYTPFTGSANQETWTLKLNDKITYDLSFKTAVGEQVINLSGLAVNDAQFEMAVGRQAVTLPAGTSGHFEIRSAIGEVVIYVPRGVAVRVRVQKALTALQAPADFTQSGNLVYSPGAAEASNALEVEVHNAIGHISLQVLP